MYIRGFRSSTMNCQSEGHWAILVTMVFEGVGWGLLEPELLKTFSNFGGSHVKKEWLVLLSSLALILPAAFGSSGKTVLAGANADSSVTINDENFPDYNFRTYIAKNFDKDKNGVLSEDEISSAKVIYLSPETLTSVVRSLEGIEFFPELAELYCYNIAVSNIDLRQNAKLAILECPLCYVSSLDISACTELRELDVSSNPLKGLDLSGHRKLQKLVAQDMEISKLDVSSNPELKILQCDYSTIFDLDISHNPKLETLTCGATYISSLDLSNAKDLTVLEAYNCRLAQLDVTNNPELVELDIFGTKIVELDLSKNSKLTKLDCANTFISPLDLSANTELTKLYCYHNSHLRELDLTYNAKLVELECYETPIEKLDLSNRTKLEYLDCSNTRIQALDVSDSPKLSYLLCSMNEISTLDLSKNPSLLSITCYGCKLTELDVRGAKGLETLDCFDNEITKLDVSANRKLWFLRCAGNQLTELDCSKNSSLLCLDCSINKIRYLNLGEKYELQDLICNDNELTSLDIAKAPNLFLLRCEFNPIKVLDITHLDRLCDGLKKHDFEHGNGVYSCFYTDPEHYDSSDCGMSLSDTTRLIPQFVTPRPEPTPGQGQPSPDKDSGIAGFVERLYTVALERPSDANGKEYWVSEISSGKRSGADCARYFLMGQEFENRQMTAERFVDILYKTFFDRVGDKSGASYWVIQLKAENMTRREVVSAFIDSTEWCNVCADFGVRSGAPTAKAERPSAKALDFATRLYECCLGRAPEQKGLAYWALALTNQEQSGAGAAKEFFTSKEFMNLKTDNTDFVTRLYRTFMDREPVEGGLEYWVGELEKGADRLTVLSGFAYSKEFTNLCREYGIDRGTI